MFDTVRWNSARIGALFTYDPQSPAKWPRPHRFVRLEQITSGLIHTPDSRLTEPGLPQSSVIRLGRGGIIRSEDRFRFLLK